MSYNKINDPLVNPSSKSNLIEPKTSPTSSVQNSSSSHTPVESSTTPDDLVQKPVQGSNDSSLYYIPKTGHNNPLFGDTQESQVFSSTPFIVNSVNQDEDSFNSLQLSGNLTNTPPVLSSNPEMVSVMNSPSNKLSFQSSSSDEAVSRPHFGETQSEKDIFNPGKDISLSEVNKENSGEQQVVDDTDEGNEGGKSMDFELSQDFSQFQFDMPASEEPTTSKVNTITTVKKELQNENKEKPKPVEKPKLVEKLINETGECSKDKDKTEVIINDDKNTKTNDNEIDSKSKIEDEKLQTESIEEMASSFLSKAGYSDITKEELLSILNKKSKNSTERKQETKRDHVYVGKDCFALWENYFFPANVHQVEKETEKLTVIFEDGFTTEFTTEQVVFKDQFEPNQKVHVKMQNGEYRNGHILHNKRVGGEMKYWCLVDTTKSMVVDRFSVRFTKEYLLPKKSANGRNSGKSADKKNGKSATRKRKTTLVVPESSSENYVTEIETKSKKKKLDDPCQLLLGLHFLITKGQQEDTDNQQQQQQQQIVGTETEETEEELATEFNEHLAVETIRNEGGCYIDKLTSRELAKTKKLVCITDITKYSTQYHSVKFLYCIANGIPVVHFDWLNDSIEQRKVLNPHDYLVPAGKDITGEKIQQNLNSERDSYTPLNGVTVHVHVGEVLKYSAREMNFLLQKIGCEVHTTHQVTKKTKRIQFDMNRIHYVLTLTNNVPVLLVNSCKEHQKDILTMEWLAQCVINNKLLDVEDSPRFRYSVTE